MSSRPVIRTDRVRLLIGVYKKEGVSDEEFRRYWLETHARTLLSIAIVKRNILKYEQMFLNDDTNQLVPALSLSRGTWDGIALYEAKSFKDIFDVFLDPEFLRVIYPSENQILQLDTARAFPLEFSTIIDKE